MAQKASGSLTITNITDGANANIWTTSTAPTTPNYTFTISNLTGADDNPRVGDIILQGVYRYTITSIGSTTVLAGSRQSLRGATGAAGGKWYSGTGITGTNTTAQVFSGSGVSSAVVGDMYLNTSTDNVYQCTTAGNASTAKWKYVGNIKGSTGSQGRSVTSVVTEYYRKLSGGSTPTSSTTGSTTIPDYVAGCTYYTRTITNFDSGNPDKSEWVTNSGLTNEIKNAYDAWIAAGAAELKVAKIIQNSEGMIVTSGINGGDVTPGTTSTYGYNTLMAPNYLGLRYNAINLAKLTTTESTPALEFYIPSVNSGGTPIQGNKGLSISATALTFYNPSSNAAQLIIGANGTLQSGNYTRGSDTKFSSNGTKIDLVNGDIITKYFRVSQGLEAGLNAGVYVHGTIEALDGTIGTDSINYWEIGNGTDYNLSSTAKMIGHGSSYIQLGDSSTWRLATNRIHTGWYTSSDSLLHFPTISSKYWDFGVHAPDAATDKFLYIRSSKSNTSASNVLQNLLYDIDDAYATPQWDYKFYIDGSGNLYATNLYFFDENGNAVQVGGADGAYLPKTGGTITGNLEVNGTLTKGSKNVAYLTATPTTNQVLIADGTTGGIKTSGYTIAKSVPSGAIFTDENVKSTEANTTKLWLVGSDTSGTRTGALKYDSGVYITTTAGTLHATTFDGNLSGTATKATQDGDGNVITTTYLKLTGGNITGAVTFGSSVSADELTVGDLVVNGNASFTNNAQFNTINGIAVGSTPKFTDTNYYHTTGSWGGTNSLTYTATANGGAGALAFTLATATTGIYGVTKLSNAIDSTSTTLAATASAVKAAYDLAASKTDNTGTVTSVRVQASSPLQSSSSTASSTTLSTTISFTNQNVNTILAGPSSGTTAAAPTFRKLVAADIPDISGTYYLASNPSGYTTNTGTVTSVRVQASSPLTSTANTASSTTLDTTIKFSNQNKNLVLAGPGTGSAAAPTFRSLVADDIPSISKSKISDFPSSLKNPNAIRLNLFNETAARAAANQGTATSYVDYDGSTASQSFSAAGKNAITSIGISGDTLSWVRADGSSGSSTVTITASVASGATVLTDTDGNAISTTGNTTPVYFSSGVPTDVTGIAFSLLPTGTGASNVAVGNHSHGNITNGGDITTTATIASGDRLVINDESESKINNSSITFGTSTTTFLTNKGTWATPVGTTYTFDGTYNASSNKAATVSTVTNAINALDGGTIGTPSASKTVTAISQTNGNISVTFGDISITKSQISDFPTSMTPAAHTHDDRYYTETEIDNRFKKYISFSHYSNTNGNNSGKYYKISINSYTGWMLNFTVKMYHAYRAFDLQISGYNYGSSHWYSPAAVILGASVTNTVEVNFGYDSNYHLWIAIPAEQYTGIGVTGFTNGYQQIDSWEDLFTITMVDGLPSTKQSTVTAYRPWYRNETVSNATSATSAGKWTTARNFTIKDSDSTNSGTAASVDGSGAVTLLLPSTIKASLSGNASTATKWASAQTVYVTLGTASTTTTIQGGSSSAQTIGVNGTLAIGNGGTGLTASPSMLTNLGSTTAANVLQASPRPGVTGTLGVGNGGTGQTSAKNAANAFLNALDTGSSTPVDADYYISQYVNGGTTTTTYHRRPMSALWSYISGKISSSGTYVTIATDQTITANQKTFEGAIRWGTASKYGAVHYDSTLDALVFSFA